MLEGASDVFLSSRSPVLTDLAGAGTSINVSEYGYNPPSAGMFGMRRGPSALRCSLAGSHDADEPFDSAGSGHC